MELERKRGITIKSSAISFTWNSVKVNIIDTPGHADFVSEVERSLSVLDGAILVISAVEGIQSQTRILFNTLKTLKIPTIIFINKIDRVGANCNKVFEDIKKAMSNKIVRLQKAHGEGSREVCLNNLDEINTTNLRGKRVTGQLLFKSKQLLIRYFMSVGSVFGLRFC